MMVRVSLQVKWILRMKHDSPGYLITLDDQPSEKSPSTASATGRFGPGVAIFVCGRAAGSPHKARSDDDRDFGRERIPTISLDHCFLGSATDEEGKKAHESPFLILFDSDTEAIYALAVAEKACKPWVVEFVSNVLVELGYSGVKVALNCLLYTSPSPRD